MELKDKLEQLNEESSLKDIQEYVNEMIVDRGFQDETLKDVMLLLTEEVGELAKEVRKSIEYKLDVSKTKELDMEGEIADVFIYLMSLCRIKNIDLFQAFKDKEEKNSKRTWK